MKYTDIKKDALRLMGKIPDTVQNEYDTSDIRAYLLGMNNSIMRAVDRMKSLSLLPPKTVELPKVKYSNFYSYRYDEIGISGEVLRVVKLDSLKLKEVPFATLKDKLSVYLEKDESFFVEYFPKYSRAFSDDEEIDLPDELARLIPYYIKADLYEEEEPVLSAAARNMFEDYLKEYAGGVDNTQRSVKVVHSI